MIKRIGGPAIVTLLVIAFFSLFTESFFSFSNAVNLIRQGCVLALVAFGQTLVLLIEGLDLSVGAVMGLASCTAAIMMLKCDSVILAILLALSIATFCGFLNGIAVNYLKLNFFVATFGMWGMALGAAMIITEERVIFGFPETLRVFHDGSLVAIPAPLIIVFMFFLIFHLLLKFTPYGVAMYAIGGNETAASLSGIRVPFRRTIMYGCCGFMAGVAGLMFLARSNAAQPLDTIGYEFDSIVAAVAGGNSLAGGRGGVTQTLIGVTLISAARIGLNMMGVNPYFQLVFIGAILIFAYVVENRMIQISPAKVLLSKFRSHGNEKK